MELSKRTLMYGRVFFCTLSVAAVVIVGMLSGTNVASAAPEEGRYPVGGFVDLGAYPALCDNPATSEIGDGTNYVEFSGISGLDSPAELRVEMLEDNGVTWSAIDYDGIEVLLNHHPVNGHGSLWAHVTVSKGDLFEIRHHAPRDGAVRTYRLMVWPEGATQPFVRIHSVELLFPTEGFCQEALLAGSTI